MIAGPDDASPLVRLPLAHLNLRCNPFGELDLATRAELATVNARDWADRLSSQRFAVQFLGDRGVGKTTHLLALGKLLPQARYIYIAEGARPRFDNSPLLLLDEAQRLGLRCFKRLLARLRSVALATHRDLSGPLQAAGFESQTHDVESATTAPCVQRILNHRIAWARRHPGPAPLIRLSTADRLLRQFRGNLRAIEAHLYDVFQELPAVVDV